MATEQFARGIDPAVAEQGDIDRLVPGWYGKMPGLGDFASRRLPADFIEFWDSWLQRSIAASRQALGDAWLGAFLRSPMWRFVLAPGLHGPDGWAGLLIPSVDSVGRYFPMTFAVRIPPPSSSVTRVLSASGWYAALEEVGLRTLSTDFTPDHLEAALGQVPLELRTSEHQVVADEFLAWSPDRAAPPLCVTVSGGDSIGSLIDETARLHFANAVWGKSMWWCIAADARTTELHCMHGLPSDDYFAVMLRGIADERDPTIDVQPLRI